ncbi:hypothetical protein CNY89_30590, partial [Amaricoccus sp. HAR-UPW-R2A-40]
ISGTAPASRQSIAAGAWKALGGGDHHALGAEGGFSISGTAPASRQSIAAGAWKALGGGDHHALGAEGG